MISATTLNPAHVREATLELTKTYPNRQVYPIVPKEAGLGGTCDVYRILAATGEHWHAKQHQMLVPLSGNILVKLGKDPARISKPGEFISIPPGTVHAFGPEKELALVASINIPGLPYPEDVYRIQAPKEPIRRELSEPRFVPLDPKYFGDNQGIATCGIYSLAQGSPWSIQLMELFSSPVGVENAMKKIFVVMEGALDLEVNGKGHTLKTEDHFITDPGDRLVLKSSTQGTPVRTLCFQLPPLHSQL